MQQRYVFLSFLLTIFFSLSANAQMQVGNQIVYGNEWINYNQNYCKIQIANDGIYRLTGSELSTAGVPVAATPANQYRLYHMGREVPMYSNVSTALSTSDYLEFFGRKNRSELDEFLFKNPSAEMMNPKFSLFSDTSAYFLTWSSTPSTVRYAATTNDLTNPPAKETFFMHTQDTLFTNFYDKEFNYIIDNDEIMFSTFVRAEGFSSAYSTERTINMNPVNLANSGGNMQVEVRTAWRDLAQKAKDANIERHKTAVAFNGKQMLRDSVTFGLDFGVKNLIFTVPLTDVKATNAINIKSLQTKATGAKLDDDHRIAYVSLTYPSTFAFGNRASFTFSLSGSTSRQYFSIENISASATPIIYDLTNNLRLIGTVNGGKADFVLPASNQKRDLVFYLDDSAVKVKIQKNIKFDNYKIAAASFLFVTHPRLLKDKNGVNQVQEYANYRSSTEGGAYRTSIIDMTQIYDQFGYGIDRHNIALRNFSNYAATQWNAKYLYLIGRGITYDECRNLSALQSQIYTVPTFGFPGSDNLISARVGTSAASLAVGRLAVFNANEISPYLDKVKAFERVQREATRSVEERAWMKRVINVAGGDVDIRTLATNQLASFAKILETNKFGSKTITYIKTSDAPVSAANNDELRFYINDGVSMLNFFGHAATTSLDFSLDSPTKMANKNRYFLFASYGCYSGLAHGVNRAIGTNYTLVENAGSIAFLSPGQYGLTNALPEFGRRFYELMGSTYYGKTIGETLKETVRTLDLPGIASQELIHHMTYQGDPAIRLTTDQGPDYTIDPRTVKSEPSIISTAQDNFNLNFEIGNIGRADNDTLRIDITRVYPDGKKKLVLTDSLVRNVKFPRQFSYKLPVGEDKNAGNNRFLITLDAKNKIKEWPNPNGETNNELYIGGQQGFSAYIISSDLNLVYPTRYSIVNTPTVKLQATTSNAFAKKQKYFFEIDTTEKFNSPNKRRYTIDQIGGLLTQNLDFQLRDSSVYYWRATPDSTAQTSYVWRTSSFQYIKGSQAGWSQAHREQFDDNELKFKYINDNGKFIYENTSAKATIKNWAYSQQRIFVDIPKHVFTSNALKLFDAPANYIKGRYLIPTNTGIIVAVFEPNNLEPWLNTKPGLYGSDINTPWQQDIPFGYKTSTPEQRKLLMDFIENVVPDNHYVALYSIQHTEVDTSYFPHQWAADSTLAITGNRNLFQVLEKQGAKEIRRTAKEGSKPYILFFKKNAPKTPTLEILASTADQAPIITADYYMDTPWFTGGVKTQNIGPAKEWSRVYWDIKEKETKDITFLNIYGINRQGKDSLLMAKVNTKEKDISTINASVFPNLRLEWITADSTNKTPVQLQYWRVTHKGLPEAVLATNKLFSFKSDTLQQGENLNVQFAAENVSEYNMDSLLVQYRIRNENNVTTTRYQRVKPLLSGSTLTADFTMSTKNIIGGKQQMDIRINPRNDQAERDTTNNFGLFDFFIKKDQKNPIIDVIVDGNHLINGDIVSPKPKISITVRDENPYLPISDTALFKVHIRYPNEKVARLIAFNNPILKFYPPSSANNNKATIELNPEFVADGEYQLLVQAKDATGNKNTEFELKDEDVANPDFYSYKIAFQVITTAAISNVLNYPNPFSTSTQFVYTLTGIEPPAYFKIQVMTISGRIVREITQNELGTLRIGTHKTDYAWDGTDQYGERLAAGVYLYKVVAKKANGEDYEAHETDTNDYFKNGIGKMVILR